MELVLHDYERFSESEVEGALAFLAEDEYRTRYALIDGGAAVWELLVWFARPRDVGIFLNTETGLQHKFDMADMKLLLPGEH